MLARDEDRPELRLHAPIPQAGNVGVATIKPVPQIDPINRIRPLRPQLPGKVVVAVDQNPRLMDPKRLGRNTRFRIGFTRPGPNRSQTHDQGERQSGSPAHTGHSSGSSDSEAERS